MLTECCAINTGDGSTQIIMAIPCNPAVGTQVRSENLADVAWRVTHTAEGCASPPSSYRADVTFSHNPGHDIQSSTTRIMAHARRSVFCTKNIRAQPGEGRRAQPQAIHQPSYAVDAVCAHAHAHRHYCCAISTAACHRSHHSRLSAAMAMQHSSSTGIACLAHPTQQTNLTPSNPGRLAAAAPTANKCTRRGCGSCIW